MRWRGVMTRGTAGVTAGCSCGTAAAGVRGAVEVTWAAEMLDSVEDA